MTTQAPPADNRPERSGDPGGTEDHRAVVGEARAGREEGGMTDDNQVDVFELGRESVCARWVFLGEWWCIPKDATEEEQRELVLKIRGNMGSDFTRCPEEYIADRLYGGFPCANPDRRHVYFCSGQYSFLAAEEGRFWANDADHRSETYQDLIEHNTDKVAPLDGPFTADAPKRVTA